MCLNGDLTVNIQPLVSVLMVTRNRPHHLAASLTAVLSQSLQGGVELCVVNDGGEKLPGLQGWVQNAVATRGWAVRWLDLPYSNGQVAARNQALALATGEFVAWCDDDDRWLPQRLDQCIAVYRRSVEKKSLALVYTDTELVTLQRNFGNWRVSDRQNFAWTQAKELLKRTNPVVPSSWLYRREAHQKIGYFDESVGHYWDWDFLLRMTHLGEFARVAACLTLYGVDAEGSNASAQPSMMRADLERLVAKHGLPDLPSSNFSLMLQDPELAKWRANTRRVWDGTPDIWNDIRDEENGG